ncbi:MAG: non-canonical purine NTP pyrophosphatase [Sandaracinaceae bacterium]
MSRRLRAPCVVIASHNAGKVAEIADLMRPYAEVLSASELQLAEPAEEAETFVAIALDKACRAAAAAGRPALSDDSGLVIPALEGQPGVRSARWAGPDRDWLGAMERLHDALGDRSRSAEMVTALALAWPDGEAVAFEGRVAGSVVWPPRGTLGFGYEPFFQPEQDERTYGEMPRLEKHADDPRARAFRALERACLR